VCTPLRAQHDTHLAQTGLKIATKPESFYFVMVGATGDLAKRRILAARFLDVIHGRLSLFVRRDEQGTAWK
jgi:glucose-6-phosphate 1-dehydrogenase